MQVSVPYRSCRAGGGGGGGGSVSEVVEARGGGGGVCCENLTPPLIPIPMALVLRVEPHHPKQARAPRLNMDPLFPVGPPNAHRTHSSSQQC